MKLTDEEITDVYKIWLKSGAGYVEYARAIESAIAPPVAAGSVDTTEFKRLCNALYLANPPLREGERLRMVANINAWGAQQRQYGWDQCATLNQEAIRQQRQRAEKAEAELEDWSQSNRLDELQRELIALQARAKELEAERDTLKESLRLVNEDRGLWMARAHEAEDARDDALARVKELEAQLARRHAPLSPEAHQAIAAARAAGQTIAATPGGLVFLNDGTGPGEGELDCPACGGSGHAGDVVTGGAA